MTLMPIWVARLPQARIIGERATSQLPRDRRTGCDTKATGVVLIGSRCVVTLCVGPDPDDIRPGFCWNRVSTNGPWLCNQSWKLADKTSLSGHALPVASVYGSATGTRLQCRDCQAGD
jgi:hypothetical protein